MHSKAKFSSFISPEPRFGYLVRLIICPIGCSSATNRLITASEHASFQINICHLDESGVYTGHFSIFALWFCTNTGMYHYYLFYCFLNVLLNCMMVISPLHEELMLWELGSLKLGYFASLFFAFCSVPCLHDYLL
ncbi:putative ribosomal protein S21e [Medicago truncatula]|uniref:Putative ribosomal protein S21e n=1 Tax=Medicago truncatula TaxID=3880 RepID=A0A396HYB1_MEDTR|nr:putative ribosomal protein S21e [Medicago truncatula]